MNNLFFGNSEIENGSKNAKDGGLAKMIREDIAMFATPKPLPHPSAKFNNEWDAGSLEDEENCPF